MTALEIMMDVSRASLPKDCPLPFTNVTRARFDGGRNRILADVIMFDGQHATMRLTRWAHGWSKGWQSLPGGDCSFEGDAWTRVMREGRADG